jgi:hypothetical protein
MRFRNKGLGTHGSPAVARLAHDLANWAIFSMAASKHRQRHVPDA